MAGALARGDEPITLTSEEVLLLRVLFELSGDDGSPFGPLEERPRREKLERARRTLAERGLADPKTLRPDREVLRRLLVVAQPDSRVVLLRSGPGHGERLLDLYQRAGAFVGYGRDLDDHTLEAPIEFRHVLEAIVGYFACDPVGEAELVSLALGPAEYFAFSVLTTEVARERESTGLGRVGRTPPARHDSAFADPSMEGQILLPGMRRRVSRVAPSLAGASFPRVPSDGAWTEALESLESKGVVDPVGDGWELTPRYHDLALGFLTHGRHVLTRFDFVDGEGGEPGTWIVREATFVPVEGSVFLLRPTQAGGLTVKELDRVGLTEVIDRAVSEIGTGDTLEEL